jgi:hypothetical protein
LARKGKTVSDSELKYPSWQTPLRQALLEGNPEKLAKKILEVEALICARLLEMASDTEHRDEREAIVDAAAILRVLKKGEL